MSFFRSKVPEKGMTNFLFRIVAFIAFVGPLVIPSSLPTPLLSMTSIQLVTIDSVRTLKSLVLEPTVNYQANALDLVVLPVNARIA